MKQLFALIVSLLLVISTNCWAGDDEDFNQIKSNLQNLFELVKNKQFDKVGDLLAPQTVFVYTDGVARNKDAEMNLIKNINLKSYKLSDFQFSRSGDVVVVSFKDEGVEKVENKMLEPVKATRLAVFQKQGDKWLIIAYGNFAKMK